MTGPSYDLLVGLHVLSAVVGFGAVSVSGTYAGRARSLAAPHQDPGLRRYFHPGTNWAERSLLLTPVLGAVVLWSGDRAAASQAWPWIGLGCWVLAAADRDGPLLARGDEDPDLACRRARRRGPGVVRAERVPQNVPYRAVGGVGDIAVLPGGGRRDDLAALMTLARSRSRTCPSASLPCPGGRYIGVVQAQATARDRPATRRGSTGVLGALVLLVVAGAMTACTAAAGDTHLGSSRAAVGHAKARPLAAKERALAEPPAGFGVGLSIATWTDPRGATENFYEGTTTPGRVLQVEILYPTLAVKAQVVKPRAAPAYRYGPYPVIVFAHGYDVDPNTYRALLVSWVAAGYVVVAPFFPDTSLAAIEAQHGVDTEYDIFNQPGDVAFVVSQVVGAAHRSPPPSRGLSRRLGGLRPT